MTNFAEFEQIIAQLLSTENNARKQAEDLFEQTKTQPDFCVSSLLHLVKSSPHVQVRNLCCVLLRTVIGTSEKSLWSVLAPQTQATVKVQLLEALEAEQTGHTRIQLANAVSELGRRLYDKEIDPHTGQPTKPSTTGAWNELLAFMLKATKSSNPSDREIALVIFGDLAGELGDELRPQIALLHQVLQGGLNDPQSLRVRLAALSATTTFLHVLTQPNERVIFQQMIPLMLDTVQAALRANEEEEARTAIEMFVDLAEVEPTFLRPHLTMVINAMVTVASTTTLDPETQHLGLEFLVTLAESKPAMVRKFPKFVETVLPIVIRMMLELEDDPEWANGHDEDDDDIEVTTCAVGEEALDRFSIALGGQTILPYMFTLIPTLVNNKSDWKHRHVGLMSISILGEGSHKQMKSQLDSIVPSILPFFQDPHPRVRWCACNTIGQMCTDFGPTLQSKFHAQLVPSLIALMDDSHNPRVQSHAASAVINFCEDCEPQVLAPYLDGLLSKLFTLLQSGKTIVQEQAITAIAAVADCAESVFIKYYDTFVPLLKSILQNANGKEHRRLRGKTMECVSLIGGAVGKEKFYQDAKEIMEQMLRTQNSELESDDPQVGFLLQSWARICKCLGQDFVPYLSFVMPPLMRSAEITPDVQVVDQDDEDEQLDNGWEFVPMGDKRLGINTSALEEKSTACNMLYCYASELKEGFFPHVDKVALLMAPLVRFYYHEGVRSAAWSILPHLLTSARLYFEKAGAANGADTTYLSNLFHFMWPHVREGLVEEIDTEMLLIALEAFAESIEAAGENTFTNEELELVVETLTVLFQDVSTRRTNRAQRKGEEDHDDEEEERINQESERDEEVLGLLGDVIGRLFKTHHTRFLPYFQKLYPIVESLLKSQLNADKQVALCIFCDLVEFLGVNALPFFTTFVPVVMANISSTDPSLRQAAVFAAGLCAQHGGQHMASLIPDVLKQLHATITSKEAKEDIFIGPTENAVSAIGKIALHQAAAVDLSQVLPFWFSCLPVVEDRVESKVTYAQLCTFIENNNTYVLGNNLSNLPKILSIFGEVLDTDLIDESVFSRILVILKQFRTAVPAEVLQSSWNSLKPEHQQKLGKYAN